MLSVCFSLGNARLKGSVYYHQTFDELFYKFLQVASYIPQLAKYSANSFGVSICTVDGQRFSIGDTNVPFTLQVIEIQLFLRRSAAVHNSPM